MNVENSTARSVCDNGERERERATCELMDLEWAAISGTRLARRGSSEMMEIRVEKSRERSAVWTNAIYNFRDFFAAN